MLKLKIGKFLEQKYHKYTGTEENLMWILTWIYKHFSFKPSFFTKSSEKSKTCQHARLFFFLFTQFVLQYTQFVHLAA